MSLIKKFIDATVLFWAIVFGIIYLIVSLLIKNYLILVIIGVALVIYRFYRWGKIVNEYKKNEKLNKSILEKDAKCISCGKIVKSNENLRLFKQQFFGKYNSYCCDDCYIPEMDNWTEHYTEKVDVLEANIIKSKNEKGNIEEKAHFKVKVEFSPEFVSLREKKSWWNNNKEKIKSDIELSLYDYIKKYFDVQKQFTILKESEPLWKDYDIDMKHIEFSVVMIIPWWRKSNESG